MPCFASVILLLVQITGSQIEAQDNPPLGVHGAPFDTSKCSLPTALVSEIRSYQTTANDIYAAATQNILKGKSYKKLEYISDTFGSRLGGSKNLEKVIDYMVQEYKALGLVNIREEKVQIPHVKKGNTVGKMLRPRYQELGVLSSGNSASTLGLTAYVFMIPSKEYLLANKEKVRGKIAVFDYQVTSVDTEEFTIAEQSGALAAVSRVLVTFSIYSLAVRAGSKTLRIPSVFITNEDMDLFRRLTKRGIEIQIYLKVINAVTQATSRNIMGDLTGKFKPNEFVLVAGHSDSWYSEGAQDDGIGIILALQVPKLLKKLNLIPKRTVKSVIFTGEEMGLFGAAAYVKAHASELSRYSAIIEADEGCFKVLGYYFPKATSQIGCILYEIMKLQEKTVGAKLLNITGNTASDITTDIYSFINLGVPGANLVGDDEKKRYYWYHHTLADTMSVINSGELDRCLALVATTVYILADLTDMVPRT